MSISSFCHEQREQQRVGQHRWLAYGLVGSSVFHGFLAYASLLMAPKTENFAQDVIEFIVVDEPETPVLGDKLVAGFPVEAIPEPVGQVIQESPQATGTLEALPLSSAQPVAAKPNSKPLAEAIPNLSADVAVQPIQPDVRVSQDSAPLLPKSQSAPVDSRQPEIETLPTNSALSAPEAQALSPAVSDLVTNDRSQTVQPSSHSTAIATNSFNLESPPSNAPVVQPPAPDTQGSDLSPPRAVAGTQTQLEKVNSSSGAIAATEGSSEFQAGFGNGTGPQNESKHQGISSTPTSDAIAVRSKPTKHSNLGEAPLISAARCISGKQPKYPRSLERRGIEARLRIEVLVDASGRAISQKIIKSTGYPEMDKAGLASALTITCPSGGGVRRLPVVFDFAQEGRD